MTCHTFEVGIIHTDHGCGSLGSGAKPGPSGALTPVLTYFPLGGFHAL